MDVYFITGASKGIGYELAQQLSEKGHFIVGLARTMKELNNGVFIQADLADTDRLGHLVEEMFAVTPKHATSFTLINNAGMVDPIGMIGTVETGDIAKAVAVNLTAPMALSNAFISKLKSFKGLKRIITVSSGAGRKAYAGWGTYCATKAGVDHFSNVIALEQENEEFPVKVISIAPGIIDTEMQEKIRSSNAAEFPLLDRFIEYKEKGQLSSAKETAEKLIQFINSENFTSSATLVDIRDLPSEGMEGIGG